MRPWEESYPHKALRSKWTLVPTTFTPFLDTSLLYVIVIHGAAWDVKKN